MTTGAHSDEVGAFVGRELEQLTRDISVDHDWFQSNVVVALELTDPVLERDIWITMVADGTAAPGNLTRSRRNVRHDHLGGGRRESERQPRRREARFAEVHRDRKSTRLTSSHIPLSRM